MRKIFLSGSEARKKLAEGARKLSEAVASTIGPFGSNYFIQKGNRITNDGVTIAKEIELQDEVENRGAWAIREAAQKANDEVGDGSTTTIILAYAIYNSCAKLLGREGVIGQRTPSEIVKQIEQERKEVTDNLVKSATPIETEEQLINSAIVAVEDADLGKLIGSAQWNLGKNGRIIVEESADKTSSIEPIKGILIDNGVGTSQTFNNLEKQTCEVEDTQILLTTITIRDIADWAKIVKLGEELVKKGKGRLVVIARAWTEEAIKFALINLNEPRSQLKIYPFTAPYVNMQERMKDLSAVTGAKFYDSENSTLEDIKVEGLGFAAKVLGRRYEAVITGNEDIITQTRVNQRVEELKANLTASVSEFETRLLEERIQQLDNGFARLKICSSSDMERKRLFDKCEDAVNAVRAAFQEGTVKGAGLAFKEIAEGLPADSLLKTPLQSINEQIMYLAPKDFAVEDWIRDPVKVLRVALERACSAASSFATASGVVCDEVPKPLDELLNRNKTASN